MRARADSGLLTQAGKLLLIGLVALGVGISAAGPLATSTSAQVTPGTFVGVAPDSKNDDGQEPLIGIVTDGVDILAYVCGGCIGGDAQELEPGDGVEWWPVAVCPGVTHSEWFRGQRTGNAAELTAATGARL